MAAFRSSLPPTAHVAVGAHDAIVLLSRAPPATTYFVHAVCASWRGAGCPSSLGDSVNNLNIRADEHGLCARADGGRTYSLVEEALVEGACRRREQPAAVPPDVGLDDFFEVARLFRFATSARRRHLAAAHRPSTCDAPRQGRAARRLHKNRTHGESVSGALAAGFEAHSTALANVARFHRDFRCGAAYCARRCDPRFSSARAGPSASETVLMAYGPYVLPDWTASRCSWARRHVYLAALAVPAPTYVCALLSRRRRTPPRSKTECRSAPPDRRHELRSAGRARAPVLDVGVHAEPVALRAARRRRRGLHAGDRRRGAARLVPHLL